MPSIYIKQKLELWEMLTGCEMQNQYKIYPGDANGQKGGNPVFKAKEKSSCFQRMCCAGNARAFEINISSKVPMNKGEYLDFEKFYFLRMKRPYKCTFFCLDRPIMDVYSIEQGQEKYIGKITNPFSCCEMKLDIYNQNNNLEYKVRGSLCQLGVMC